MMSSRTLDSKVALVTGASSGMGRAVALALAEQGAKLVCCDIRAQANPAGYEKDINITTADLITKQGGSASFQKVDISNPQEVEEAFQNAISKHNRLDIVVNCAGYWAPFRDFADEDDALWEKMVAINTLGTAKCNRLAIRQFLKQHVDEVAYSATKSSINHMTRAGAIDHAKDYININCIAPGTVATGMARANIEDKDLYTLMKKATPWPRIGTSEDIAGVALFLCMPQSQWMTGQVLAVDGGMTLGVAG